MKHKMACIVPSGGARCENCQAKHYRCLLVPPKEVMGGKGGPLGSQQAKGVLRKARKAITLGKSNMLHYTFAANGKVRTGEN